MKKPVGIVYPNGRVRLEDGRLTHLKHLPHNRYALYSLRRLNDPDIEIHWRGSRKGGKWHGQYVRYLQETFKDSVFLPGYEETLEGLILYRDWLYSWDVPIGSFNKAAGHLHFRTSGVRPYPTLPDDEVPEQPFLSARIHYPNRYYIEEGWSWLWDIVGAYAWGAGSLIYPRDGWEYSSNWSGHPLAWVDARWLINPWHRVPGELPQVRPMPTFAPFNLPDDHDYRRRWYEANAFLLGAEARQIQDHLDIVRVVGSWEPKGRLLMRLVTAAWKDAVDEGRALPGVAGRLAKRTANGLWGSLCAQGSYKTVNHRTGEYRDAPAITPRSEALAGMIVTLVRMKLFAEGLTQMPAILGHTDSVITPEGYGPPQHVRGNELGQWRIKEKMYNLQAFGLTTRRYKLTSEKDAPWVYVNAGERGERAERMFGQRLRRWVDPDALDPPINDPHNAHHEWR